MSLKYIYSVLLLILYPILSFSNGGVIIESSGKVFLERFEVISDATMGVDLIKGDIVSTGDDGSALIVLSDGAMIDLFSNSMFVLPELKDNNSNTTTLLGKIWEDIQIKFSDVEYSNAQSGTVGAIRSSTEEEIISNTILSDNKIEELQKTIDLLSSEGLSENTTLQLKAIIYEEYEQFEEAERIYLMLIDTNPNEFFYYNMLIDLYLKIDFYNHAKKIIEKKPKL